MKKVLEALEAGKELDNAEGWKNRAFAAQSVASILGGVFAIAAVTGHRFDVSPDQLAAMGGGVVALVSGASALVGVLTSKRIGLRRKSCK